MKTVLDATPARFFAEQVSMFISWILWLNVSPAKTLFPSVHDSVRFSRGCGVTLHFMLTKSPLKISNFVSGGSKANIGGTRIEKQIQKYTLQFYNPMQMKSKLYSGLALIL